ncbi:MAG: type 3-dehydroquinate dehydratase [Bacteroidota bacterium]|jgi:3-dehydroquinate dehydratase-2|nr:3-dehydroquinate dehydratase [Chitinophagaceae bacterium]
MQIHIVNGPNLNLLGKREPAIYGNESFDDYLKQLEAKYPNVQLHYFQSNVEGEIINYLQEQGFSADAIIINPGGYSHTSVSIADALKAITTKAIEVHISNVYARETFRHQSITGANCVGVISGLGLKGYALAIDFFIQ